MRTKIKNSYKHSGDAKLSLLTLRIMESLKDNPNFPNPTPALATLESAHQEFAQALKYRAGSTDHAYRPRTTKKPL
jgi:hypothetical protein